MKNNCKYFPHAVDIQMGATRQKQKKCGKRQQQQKQLN